MKNIVISGTDKASAVRDFIKSMMEKGVFSMVLAPVNVEGSITCALSSAADLDRIVPFAPVMPVSMAQMASELTKKGPASGGRKTGVLLRSCEARALTELIKLHQADRESLVLMGFDCGGTVSLRDFNEGRQDAPVREACRICEYPEPLNTDIVFGCAGFENENILPVVALTPAGEAMLEGQGQADDSAAARRNEAVENMKKQRLAEKEKLFAEYAVKYHGLDSLRKIFAACINCHNCRNHCPVCYCRECFFDSGTFEWKADSYMARAEKNSSLAMPDDRLLFHLTRINHMASSCVGCGMCEDACPAGIPVFALFRLTAEKVQQAFDYSAGRNPEEPLPVTEFREKELEHIG